MKAPENLNDFKSLIQGMNHRERFVFESANYLKTKYEDSTLKIEVYHTYLRETKNQDRNVTIHLVDFDGKPLMKKAKLLRLWSNDFYEKVFAMLAKESEIDSNKVSNLIEVSE